MPKINTYQTDGTINLEDRLLGSDDAQGNKPTRQYRIGDLVDFISSSTNTDGLAYKFSSGAVNKNAHGYFQANNTIIREVTEIYLNNITRDGINAEKFFAVMKEDDTPIYFKLADAKDPSKIAYFNIISIEKEPQDAYYKFNVALMNTLGYGKLVDLNDYYLTVNVTAEFEVPTKTSDLENDGEGTNPFITLNDVFRENTLINGGFFHVANYEYSMWADKYIINNTVYSEYVSGNVTLNDGDDDFDRIDVIVLNDDGTFAVVEGVPSADPVKPSINIETQLEVTFIIVTAESTEPEGAENLLMYDENLQQAGDEWNTYRSTARIILDTTEQHFSGAKSIKFASVIENDRIELSSTVGFERDDVDVLVFSILSETNQKIHIYFAPSLSTSVHHNMETLTLENGKYGFNQAVTTWQTIAIPTNLFNLPSGIIRKLIFKNRFNDTATTTTTFYLDNIFLQKTGGNGGDTGDFLKVSNNLNDVQDKEVSRNNLNVYSKPEVDALMADKQYNNIADLLANQTEQTETQRIVVLDASADTNITFPIGETRLQAYYQFLGVATGSIDDYRLVSAPYGNHTGGGGISNIYEASGSTTLLSDHKNAIIRFSGYGNLIIPNGLGLKFNAVVKRTDNQSVGLVVAENIILETPEDEVARIFGKNNAIEIVLEKIDGGKEYWGVYGALEKPIKIMGGLPQTINIANDLSIQQMTFNHVYKSADYPLFTTTKDYFTIYSTDHEGYGTSAIWWGEMDNPEFDGFVERSRILVGARDSYQAESPFLIKIPILKSGLISDTYFLYFHTDGSDPENSSGIQETHLITTSGGAAPHLCAWTERKDSGGNNVFHLEADETHTGYGRIWEKSDGSFVAFHSSISTGAPPDKKSRFSSSSDGITWVRNMQKIDAFNDFIDDGGSGKRFRRLDIQYLCEISGVVYGIVATRTTPYDGLEYLSLCTLDSTTYIPDTYIKDIFIFDNVFYQFIIHLEDNIVFISIRDSDGGLSFNGDWYIYKYPFQSLGL